MKNKYMCRTEDIKISIIVPVYNASKYLKACIESIQNQTLKEWELILINDGSTDDSGKICTEYSKKDERIKVVHKKNEGVSIARNTGLFLAQGEFVGFVDSDDTIVPLMYEKLYATARKESAQIVMCDAVTIYCDGREEKDTITQLPTSCVIERNDWKPELLKEMAGSAWRCIYHNDLIKKYSVCFPEGLKFSEDRVFNIYMMGYSEKLAYLKEGFYNRLIWEGSAVHRFHRDYFNAVKYAARCTEQALKEAWNDDNKYQEAYLEQFIVASFAAINNFFYKTSTLSYIEKYQAAKQLCADEQLRKALQKNPCGGIRRRWILKNRVMVLSLCAMYLNWKYKR